MSGIVYLIGAGPGDPGLITLKGAELVKKAQVLVYDYLAAPEILSLASEGTRLIYVGKQSGKHTKTQEEINQILIDEAKSGLIVARLKGGDPYIFGRGGEEAQELYKAGIPFEVVPGISSTIAAAAYAGIPLTHRDFNSQVAIITGHEKPEKSQSAHDWAALAKMGTISMVMGVKNLNSVCNKLIEAGRSADTPSALIQWGTSNRQRTITARLADIAAKAELENIGPPALFVSGGVVSLRDELNWFEKRPLFGRNILVTRSRKQASRLSQALNNLGAQVYERPTIEIKAIDKRGHYQAALNGLPNYSWLIFTSPNGAEIFLKNLFESGRDARALANLKIAVVGPGTSEALKAFGLKADLMPEQYVAESLLESLLKQDIKGKKILLPRAKDGRNVLPEGLLKAGAILDILPVYETVNPSWEDDLPEKIDLMTVCSSSTAEGLAAILSLEERKKYPTASIGPISSQTALELGFKVVVEAEKSTIDCLVDSIIKYFSASKAH